VAHLRVVAVVELLHQFIALSLMDLGYVPVVMVLLAYVALTKLYNDFANPVFGGKRKVTQQDCMASLMHPHVHLGGWQPMGLTARSIFVGNLLGDWMLVAVLIPQELLGASRMVQNLVAGYIKPHTYSTTMLILLLTVLVFLEMAMLVTQARNNGSRCALET